MAIVGRYFSFFFILVFCQSCFLFSHGPKPNEFQQNPILYPIKPGIIDEASGMVASTTMPGSLWVHEDSGNPAAIHLISGTGEHLGKIDLWAHNRDWEDIADGPGPEEGVNYLYIGDIGDNTEVYKEYKIYRLKEPLSLEQNYPSFDEIRFRYSDRPNGLDSEAMIVDPDTKDIYIITKRQFFAVRVYRLRYPYSITEENTAEFVGTIPFTGITAADISSDGRQLMIKNYDAAFYWQRRKNETIYQALSRPRDIGLPYYVEAQGEAICFDYDEKGYYTISERPNTTESVNLQYYQRK
jgi:hypothetical protein